MKRELNKKENHVAAGVSLRLIEGMPNLASKIVTPRPA
jgi:hypothetical protein